MTPRAMRTHHAFDSTENPSKSSVTLRSSVRPTAEPATSRGRCGVRRRKYADVTEAAVAAAQAYGDRKRDRPLLTLWFPQIPLIDFAPEAFGVLRTMPEPSEGSSSPAKCGILARSRASRRCLYNGGE